MEKGLEVQVDKLNLSEQRPAAAENQQHAELHLQEHHQQKQRGYYPTPLSTCQATPEILCSILVPAIQK